MQGFARSLVCWWAARTEPKTPIRIKPPNACTLTASIILLGVSPTYGRGYFEAFSRPAILPESATERAAQAFPVRLGLVRLTECFPRSRKRSGCLQRPVKGFVVIFGRQFKTCHDFSFEVTDNSALCTLGLRYIRQSPREGLLSIRRTIPASQPRLSEVV